MKKIAITTGDPAGIGAEIVAKVLKFRKPDQNAIYIVYGENYNDVLNVKIIKSPKEAINKDIIYHIPIGHKIQKGNPSAESGKIAYQILQRVAKDLNDKNIDAVVTAPVSKEMIQKTYPEFIGHTEFFASQSNINVNDVTMSFWSETFNLVLLTTHLSIMEAMEKLTYEFLYNKLFQIYSQIKKIVKDPKIAILGINPHAGENGRFGTVDEELKKVLKTLKKHDINIDGPFPADSFFSSKFSQYNFVISAFHDQGLIPFKLINFSEGVNVTLGLPYIRTSCDHGTAFDIANKGVANENSMQKALDFAEFLLLKQAKKDRAYSVFAKYYDAYMDHVNYDDWAEFILDKYHDFTDLDLKTIFELACGTANLSTRMVEKGYKVFASDNSAEMLKIADSKKFKPILFYHNFLNPIPVKDIDLILLIFDSINYISDKQDIEKLFVNVYNALNYNGIFIFDISTIKNCQDNFDGFVNLEDTSTSYFIHESTYSGNKLISNLTFFEKQGFLYKRRDEKHIQYIYETKTILDIIEKSPLKLKGYFSLRRPTVNLLSSLLSPEEIDYDYDRIFFILKKEI